MRDQVNITNVGISIHKIMVLIYLSLSQQEFPEIQTIC